MAAINVPALFDSIAKRYDTLNWFISLGMYRRWNSAVVQKVCAELVTAKQMKLLDVGCGTGEVLAAIESQCHLMDVDLHGIDPSKEMLSVAQQRVQRTTLMLGSAEALPYEDGAFSLVTTMYTVRNFESVAKSFQEIRRVLSSDGQLIVMDLFRPTWCASVHTLWTTFVVAKLLSRLSGNPAAYSYLASSIENQISESELIAEAENAGFDVGSVERFLLGSVRLFTFKVRHETRDQRVQ